MQRGKGELRCVPDNEVVVVVVDQRGDAAVRIVLGKLGGLLLFLGEVQVDGLVCQAEFPEDKGVLPVTGDAVSSVFCMGKEPSQTIR